MRYQNPVIPGFHPDPSVCRVGEDYYLVTSSFEFFPGVPIFHSRDLVHWRQLGHVLTRPSQLPLEKCGASAGIFAPTIRHHAGRFYMITTNVSGLGNFIVTSEDPAGLWSEPVKVEHGGIDPSLYFDEDGKVYFTGTGNGGISLAEIDVTTGRLLSAPCVVWAGTGGQYPEGPHLYKIGGFYYLMVAEGGTEYGHMETIARAPTPTGPYESCPHNPLLTHRSRQSPIQGTGHADLFQDHRGQWWLIFLAVRPVPYPPCYHLGRETFLAPVTWTADGWPLVNGGQLVTLDMEADTPAAQPWPVEPELDDFDAPDLRLCWNFLRNPHAADGSLTERPGSLRLHGSPVTLDADDSPAWVGRRQEHFDCTFQAELEFKPRRAGDEAGLTAYMNPRHHYELAVTRGGRGRRIIVRRRIGSLQAVVAEAPLPPGPVTLTIAATSKEYRFLFRQKDGTDVCLATAETKYLATEVAGGFTGVYLAMYATGNGAPAAAPADFAWCRYAAGT